VPRVIAIPGSIDTFGEEADLVRVIGRIAHIETVVGAHAQGQRSHASRLACTHNRYVLHDAGIRVEYRELPFFLNEAEPRLPLRFVVSVTEALDVRGFFRCFCYIRPKIFTILRRAKPSETYSFWRARNTPQFWLLVTRVLPVVQPSS